jgi:hypothetical protein
VKNQRYIQNTAWEEEDKQIDEELKMKLTDLKEPLPSPKPLKISLNSPCEKKRESFDFDFHLISKRRLLSNFKK